MTWKDVLVLVFTVVFIVVGVLWFSMELGGVAR